MKYVRKQEFCDESGFPFFEGRHCSLSDTSCDILSALGIGFGDPHFKNITGYFIEYTEYRGLYSLSFVFGDFKGVPTESHFVRNGYLTELRQLVSMLCTSVEEDR